MPHYCKFIGIAAIIVLRATPALANDCATTNVVENRKPALHFQPFPMVNPETGDRYHPNDPISIPQASGQPKIVRAEDYFREINDTEQKLNAWGYSLRDGGASTLSQLNTCQTLLQDQARRIDKAVAAEQAKFMENDDDWMKRWNTMKDEYAKMIPSWDELYRNANDEKYQVYMPTVPVYQPPQPKLERREIKFSKEKTYSLAQGSSGSFKAELLPYYKVGANKVEARGEAGIHVKGGMLGQWEGEIATLATEAISPGSGPLVVNLRASVINGKKTWNKPMVETGKLRYYSSVRASEAYEVTYRFAVGPIPMAGTVGIRGEVGFQWGIELLPLQVGAFTGPFAAVDAYAQVGADVAVGGVGVGGRLRVAEYSLMLQGNALFTYEEEPLITVNVALTSDLTLLAGDLYAYAYVEYPIPWPPWHDRSEWRHAFFEWNGFKKKGTLFDYKAKLGRDGLVAEGQLSAEDILEMNHVNRVAYVEQLEQLMTKAIERTRETSAWLSSPTNTAVAAQTAKLLDLASAEQNSIKEFWASVNHEN